MTPTRPQHYLLRLRRGGPLVPARLYWLDHAPEDPESNKLDRGRLSIITCVEIAGESVPPEEILDRFHRGPGHWRYAEPISEPEYNFQLARLAWSKRTQRIDPRRRLDPAQLPLPDFTRENAL